MTRSWRLAAITLAVIAAFVLSPSARATHCPPEHYPHPPGVPDDYPCPDPNQTPQPTTPAPTPKPSATPAPTAAPTPAPRPRVSTRTAAPTAAAPIVEVPTPEATSSPVIVVGGPIDDEGELEVDSTSDKASSWVFGFIVGLIVGGFGGRASWGIQRRRRQQVFG